MLTELQGDDERRHLHLEPGRPADGVNQHAFGFFSRVDGKVEDEIGVAAAGPSLHEPFAKGGSGLVVVFAHAATLPLCAAREAAR